MAKRMATRYDEFIETALLEPHRDPYSEAVRTVAEAGYVASVSAHPRPTAWLALDWRQEHRWLVVADYIVTSRRGPITKVTGPNCEAIHGGEYVYVPGEWTPLEFGEVACRSGLYHLTTDPTQYLAIGCRVWEAEHTGIVDMRDAKVGVRSCRITTERPDLVPQWWRNVEAFVATLNDVPWLDPQGEPDPEWRMVSSSPVTMNSLKWTVKSAAGAVAADNERDAVMSVAFYAALHAAWDVARGVPLSAASDAGLMAMVIAVEDLIDAAHIEAATRVWDVWRRGYILFGEVDGQLWVREVASHG